MSEGSGSVSYRRHAWRVGGRTLLAKTCPDCGLFLSANQYYRDRGMWDQYCRTCKGRRIRASPSQRDVPDCRRRMYASRKIIQDFTRTHAHRHGEHWIESDHVVLRDPNLSLAEKAIRLQRTYIAVVNQVVLHQYESKTVDLFVDEIERLIADPQKPDA